jgi:hypothetical protein
VVLVLPALRRREVGGNEHRRRARGGGRATTHPRRSRRRLPSPQQQGGGGGAAARWVAVLGIGEGHAGGGRAHPELLCRAELETLCRRPDVLLRWFSRRRSSTTSAECAGLADVKIWLEHLLQIIRPWNGEFDTGAADSTLLSESANFESSWSWFCHCHTRFVCSQELRFEIYRLTCQAHECCKKNFPRLKIPARSHCKNLQHRGRSTCIIMACSMQHTTRAITGGPVYLSP